MESKIEVKRCRQIVFKGLEDDAAYKEIHLLYLDSEDAILGVANPKEGDVPDFFVIDEDIKAIRKFNGQTD